MITLLDVCRQVRDYVRVPPAVSDPGLQVGHSRLDGLLDLLHIRLVDGLLDGLEVLLEERSGWWVGQVLHLLARHQRGQKRKVLSQAHKDPKLV